MILFFSLLSVCAAQNRWRVYNDSAYQKTSSFYQACTALTSSKPISKKQFTIDQKLIKLANQLYNNDNFSLSELKAKTVQYKNSSISQRNTNGVETIEFNANTEGNIRLSVKAILAGNTLKDKQILLETNTQVLCNGDYLYVNGLDFLYLRRLIDMIAFPMPLKPYQSILEIAGTD